MSVKEIRELNDEVVEVGASRDEGSLSIKDEVSWEEKDCEVEDDSNDEDDVEEFSIGDTMLARGGERERWDSESLEEAVDWDEVEGFGDDEGFGGEGFSYETMGKGSGGDLYGAGKSLGVGDLYGVGQNRGSSDLYSSSSGQGGESSMYSLGDVSRKGLSGAVYNVGEMKPKRKKREGGRRVGGSGLESVSGKRGGRRRGVSIL